MKNAQTVTTKLAFRVRIDPCPSGLVLMVGGIASALVPYSFLKDQVIDDFEDGELQLMQILEVAESFQDLADTLRDYAKNSLKPGADE